MVSVNVGVLMMFMVLIRLFGVMVLIVRLELSCVMFCLCSEFICILLWLLVSVCSWLLGVRCMMCVGLYCVFIGVLLFLWWLVKLGMLCMC